MKKPLDRVLSDYTHSENAIPRKRSSLAQKLDSATGCLFNVFLFCYLLAFSRTVTCTLALTLGALVLAVASTTASVRSVSSTNGLP